MRMCDASDSVWLRYLPTLVDTHLQVWTKGPQSERNQAKSWKTESLNVGGLGLLYNKQMEFCTHAVQKTKI